MTRNDPAVLPAHRSFKVVARDSACGEAVHSHLPPSNTATPTSVTPIATITKPVVRDWCECTIDRIRLALCVSNTLRLDSAPFVRLLTCLTADRLARGDGRLTAAQYCLCPYRKHHGHHEEKRREGRKSAQ
jgi:hypothetical protein